MVTLPAPSRHDRASSASKASIPPAGRYRWTLVVEAPNLADRHDLGVTTVFAADAEANADAEQHGDEDAASISYLKEQQWTNPFATASAAMRSMRASFRVPARLQPVTGGEAVVAAPASGRFAADTLLSIGATVQAGQPLGRLEPRLAGGADRVTLDADVAEATAALESARAEQTRAERLVAERAVPGRRVEEARRQVAVAEARLRAADARLAQRDETLRTGGGVASGNAFTLRAPIAGRLIEVSATLGASYDEGAPLFRIVKTDELELQAFVPAVDADRARQRHSAGARTAGPQRSAPAAHAPRARFRCDRSRDARADGAVRGRQPARPNCWSARAAPPSCTRATKPRCSRCRPEPC